MQTWSPIGVTLHQETGFLDVDPQTFTYLSNQFASAGQYDNRLTCLHLILTNLAITTRCTTLRKISTHNIRHFFLLPARDPLRLRSSHYSQNILAGADIPLSNHHFLEIWVQGVTAQFSNMMLQCILLAYDTNRDRHRSISRPKSAILIEMTEEECSPHS